MVKNTLILLLYFIHLSINATSCPFAQSDTQDFNANRLWNEISSAKMNKEQIEDIKNYVNNPFGWSALNYAIELGDYKSAIIIATYCEDINRRDLLVKGSSVKMNALERLLYHTKYTNTNFENGMQDEQLVLSYVLLGRNIDIKNFPKTLSPLIKACYLGFNDLIIYIVEKNGTGFDKQHGDPLYFTIQRGNLDMARYLIEKGVNIPTGNWNLFNASINSKKPEVVDFLVNYGLNISEGHYVRHAFGFLQQEIKNLDGNLYHSLPGLEFFCYILEKGANPNYWLITEGFDPINYERSLDLCSLWQAFKLPSETNGQYLYKNHVIQILLEHGAVMPPENIE